ncbi:hypothetical protein [Lacticaseibacillus porcinae]|uniref:baeRF6 domain-containing protein n=1 Tax=Lacticaseibacillus porcinae TaxID=1123687 RepID=UPI000F798225|nr:hypothetical protein [Lacticaseibacillus porcinae]
MTEFATLQDFLTHTDHGPYVSIYLSKLPHQAFPAISLALRHQIEHAQSVMAEIFPKVAWQPYADQLETIFDDPARFNGITKGIGVLCDGQQVALFLMAEPVSDTAMVTTQPQILPLIADHQSRYDFDLLVLQRDRIALFHHDGDTLVEVILPDEAPRTLVAALGEEQGGPQLNSIRQGSDAVSYHGHGDKSAEQLADTKRYFQQVDAYLIAHRDFPLALWGLPQNIALFRSLSRNLNLSAVELALSPNELSSTVMARVAVTLTSDFDSEARHELLAQINAARDRKCLRVDLNGIAQAVAVHAVDRLLIQTGARVKGELIHGEFTTASLKAQHNNVLNDLAIAVVAQGGTVSLLPKPQLDEPVVAITRYAL